MTLRAGALLRSISPVATVVVAAVFVAQVVGTVLGPARRAQSLAIRLERARGRYIAEDVLLRALATQRGWHAGRVLRLPEGELSNRPLRPARVEMRRIGGEPSLLCVLRRSDHELVYLAGYARGVLPPVFGWAVGAVAHDPRELGAGLIARGRVARLSMDPSRQDAHPFAYTSGWSAPPDLTVAATARAGDRSFRMHSSNFRRSPELPLIERGCPFELDSFMLGRVRGDRLIAAFRTERDLVIDVAGHLWLGTPGRTLLVGTSGRTVVVRVGGSVFVRGAVEMLGPRDRLVLVAGFAGRGSQTLRPPAGSEPIGVLDAGARGSTIRIQAVVISADDVRLRGAAVRLDGTLLAGGKIVCDGETRLEVRADTRFADLTLPCRGLPVVAGTESLDRIVGLRFLASEPLPERAVD